jgi:hypothetical protein
MQADPIYTELEANVGRQVKVKVFGTDYIGVIDQVTPQSVIMISGATNPCRITLRTDAVDAVLVFTTPKSEAA